ncbi:acetoacetyl-CoA synthetase [Fontimonas thermophila]|uniref:Acetoacetyl-CoA synthetase n=1 Tax=Fontimonas thermophila TaxID=1076937 RepID=A0A1I2KAP8_9GAMM|nr:acetoacetate--CoA ligase [Fontimonas thermophila]SFF63523.1 acetoacetyl-CoA synthetase [Fontimonas thermophila]
MKTDSRPLWTPPAERIASSALTRFARPLGFSPPDYEALWRWSIDQPERFWRAVWEFCALRAASPPRAILEDAQCMPGARWFPGSTLNFAEHLLRHAGSAPAVIAIDERGRRRELSRDDLRGRVAEVAAALASDGVGVGDRVAGFLPNTLEAVIAMLATTSLGAVWSSCSPDFGESGVLERFGQIEPKVLFACDGYTYAGKPVDTRTRVARIAAGLPGLKRLVLVPFLDEVPDSSMLPAAVSMPDYRVRGASLRFAPVPFDAPLYILYSSGTTGKPKCIVHGVGGTLLQHLKELVLQSDVAPGDRLFFFTTCGWMMWNWLVSGLAAGATVVLYDGSPFHPGPEALWRLAERERLNQFGTSPKYLSALEKSGYEPMRMHDLGSLRTVFSTGSPLMPEQFDYAYRAVKADVQLASISGGTDIISCFALGNPWTPVYRGELQGPGLGMAVEVFDDAGRPRRGAPGELVCTRPFPSMPIGFWNDPDGSRYRAAYFARFPGVWHHGDFAEITAHGGFIISGRSDATLNPGGVRIGTAEIYRIVDAQPEVLESVVVGYRHDGDEDVILFVRLREGCVLDDALVRRIKEAIRSALTPRHVPARILACPEVPRTISGKITELAVRSLLHGEPVKNTEALANPQALDYFRSLAADWRR